MKQTKPQKRHQARLKTMVKPLVLFTAFGLSQQVHAIDSPFSQIPLHLQNTTVSNAQAPVPNIVIQFDDSASMNYVPEKDENPNSTNSGVSRISIARSALKKILESTDPKKVNWSLISLWGNEQVNLGGWEKGWSTKNYVEDYLAGKREFRMEQDEILKIVNALSPNAGTPAVARYMDAMHLLRKELDKPTTFRCQKSYIVVFSDGDGNGFISTPTVSGTTFKPSTTPYIFAHMYDKNKIPDSLYNYFRTWAAHDNPYTYSLENATQFLNPPPASVSTPAVAWSLKVPLLTRDASGNFKWNMNSTTNAHQGYPTALREFTWGFHPDSLPLLANMAYNDLKTSADGVDAAGMSWDDKTEVNGKANNAVQNIKTYAIGFGAGLSPAGRYALNNMSTGNNFEAMNASSEADLLDAFNKILSDIASDNQINPPASVATIAPSLSYQDDVSQVPAAAATIHLDLASGSSEIRFYKMTKNGLSYIVDSNNYTLPDFSQRKILINEGGSSNAVSWFEPGQFNKNNSFFDLTNSTNANEWQNALMPWIARSQPDANIAAQTGNSVKYRVRSEGKPNTRNMGDVVGASLYPVGETKYNREQYLITAANDGMVYLFESSSNANHPYTLKLNYIPAGMQRQGADDTVAKYFKHIADEKYMKDESHSHQFMINGDFTVRTTEKNYPQRIFMSGNMGQGGRGSYSLNIGGVTAKDNQKVGLAASDWKASVPLFETPKVSNNMGYTIGAPQIGRVSKERSIVFGNGTVTQQTDLANVYYATFVNSGINHPNYTSGTGNARRHSSESALYVYNSLNKENVGLRTTGHGENTNTSGTLLQKIVASPNGGGLAQATLVDNDFDGVIDIAYAGDYNGNMYRFDLRSSPGSWIATRIFTTQNNRPITSAPAVYRDDTNKYIVVFGTGSDVYQSDLDDKNVQSVYGIYDDLTVKTPATVTVGQLLKQTIIRANSVSGYKTRDLTANAISDTQKGWYFNLDYEKDSGERVVIKPSMLLKTVLLTTRQYYKVETGNTSKDVCLPTSSSTTTSTKSSSWVMQFRADTGGKLPSEATAGEDVDLYAYVDFARANDTGKYKTRNVASMTAGYQIDGGGVFSYALLFGGNDSSQPGNVGSAYTLDGDAGGSGEDIPLTSTPIVPKKCTSRDAQNMIFGSNSADTTSSGVNESVSVYAKQCATASLKRISWREIF